MMKKTAVSEKLEHALDAGATNLDMMAPNRPGNEQIRRIEIPPVNPFPKDKGRSVEDRWSTAPPPWMVENEEERNKLSKLWEKKGPRRVKIDVIGTTADETPPSKAAELRRAAAEKKGMQEQFREWFEGGRGARARGRGGAGRRSGGRR